MPHKPKLDGSPRKVVTEKRKGPPCPTCGRAQNISDVPKTEEEIAKLLARKAKVDAKVAKLAGISVVAV